jgi:hypothetical protein
MPYLGLVGKHHVLLTLMAWTQEEKTSLLYIYRSGGNTLL